MKERWVIYVDIEGFGVLYGRDKQVLLSLGDLMEAIFLIAEKFCNESPDRIFAHQTGDGFVIVSEFGAESLELPIAISIALLRHVAAHGRFAKASIGEGDFADITGLYPESVLKARLKDGSVRMGDGLMTLFPVMGTALIDAVAVAKRSPSGALLTVASSNNTRIPAECVFKVVPDAAVLSIDWVHSQLLLVSQIQAKTGLRCPTVAEIEEAFFQYESTQGPPTGWFDSTSQLLSLCPIKE
jgi:hypothetical protein